MSRMVLAGLGFCLILAGVWAQPEGDGLDAASYASVSAAVDEAGKGTLTFYAYVSDRPSAETLAQLTQWLKGPSDAVKVQKYGDGFQISGNGKQQFETRGGLIHGEIDAIGLARILRSMGIKRLQMSAHRSARGGPANSASANVNTAAPVPFEFHLGYPLRTIVAKLSPLLLVLIVPIGVVVLGRRRALRPDGEAAVRWYRFWRSVHWAVLGCWLCWFIALGATHAEELAGDFLSSNPQLGAYGLLSVISFFPPWLATTICNVIAVEVHARLRELDESSRTIFRRTALQIGSFMLPIFLAVVGFYIIRSGQYIAGACVLAAALACRLVFGRLARRGPDRTPYPLLSGELCERIQRLSDLTGTKLNQVMVIPTGKMRDTNAAAASGGQVFVTDHLVQVMSKREVDAIVAHELGHLKHHHPTWLLMAFLGAMVATYILGRQMALFGSWASEAPIGLIVALLATYYLSRRFEFATDSYAAWLTGDPEALITGLIRLHRTNLMPMQWGAVSETLVTHPSTSLRLENIARQNGISRQRLEEIVASTNDAADHYELPPMSEEKIFAAVRTKWIGRNLMISLAVLILPPAAAGLIATYHAPESWRLGICLIGALATIVFALIAQNVAAVGGYAEVRRRLGARLRRDGVPLDTMSNCFVGLSPGDVPRMYANSSNWDMGFLIFIGDKLFYVGEEARFMLRADQVSEIRVGPGAPSWWGLKYVYLTWSDPESKSGGTLNLRPAEVRSMLGLRLATPGLLERLESWRKQSTSAEEVPQALAEFTTPQFGEIIGVSPKREGQFGLVLTTLAIFFGIGSLVAYLLGLPFDFDEFIGWCVPLTACLTILIMQVPAWRHREPVKSEQASRD